MRTTPWRLLSAYLGRIALNWRIACLRVVYQKQTLSQCGRGLSSSSCFCKPSFCCRVTGQCNAAHPAKKSSRFCPYRAEARAAWRECPGRCCVYQQSVLSQELVQTVRGAEKLIAEVENGVLLREKMQIHGERILGKRLARISGKVQQHVHAACWGENIGAESIEAFDDEAFEVALPEHEVGECWVMRYVSTERDAGSRHHKKVDAVLVLHRFWLLQSMICCIVYIQYVHLKNLIFNI